MAFKLQDSNDLGVDTRNVVKSVNLQSRTLEIIGSDETVGRFYV